MDTGVPIPFPHDLAPTDDEWEKSLVEVDAAIVLVVRGLAVRVRLTGLALADAIAGAAAARAQVAGVAFHLDRDEPAGPATITVGPIA
jgi:hypothetical protein